MGSDWLTANEARRIACSEVSYIMNLIKKAAYRGSHEIYINGFLNLDIVEVFKNYGYNVSYIDKEMDEDHYGKPEDNFKVSKTLISWK